MIKIKISKLEETAKSRPEGYLDEFLAHGHIESGFLWLNDDAYAALCARFGGTIGPASIIRSRFQICKSCPQSKDAGFGCTHHAGCCFGQWRRQLENKCPEGKW